VTAVSIAGAAKVVVYDAPLSSSYQALFNAMINGGVNVISNSWSSCEDQVPVAESQSIDSILQTAAGAGISVFSGTGDTGSTCLDGAPNTIGVPANSPHATAVGGSTLTFGPGFLYGSETWWDGTTRQPPTGQGGFGVSKVFARPSYQNGLTNSPMRSVPDVVGYADPINGMLLCQADAGGCPTGDLHGGTSMSAPEWAAYAAILNRVIGHSLGAANPALYALAGSTGFHTPAGMGSDFAHVGLGSPNLSPLALGLIGSAPGPVSNVRSQVYYASTVQNGTEILPQSSVDADGSSMARIGVRLLDANGFSISGKNVQLTMNPGSHAVITPLVPVTASSLHFRKAAVIRSSPGPVPRSRMPTVRFNSRPPTPWQRR
jgi:hypothetical protein